MQGHSPHFRQDTLLLAQSRCFGISWFKRRVMPISRSLACAGGHGTLGCPVVWVTKRAIKFTSGCCLRNPRQYCMVIESTKRVGFTSHDLLLSYATFWKTYRAKWSNVLRFQTATTHGVCDTCQEYKEQFRCASGACWLMFGQFWANIFQRSFRENPKTLTQSSEPPDQIVVVMLPQQQTLTSIFLHAESNCITGVVYFPLLNMPLFLQFFLQVRLSQKKLRTSSCSSTLLVVTKTT